MSAKFGGLVTKEAEMEHFNFLNELRVKWNVDSEKLINLEARITCKYFDYLIWKEPYLNLSAQFLKIEWGYSLIESLRIKMIQAIYDIQITFWLFFGLHFLFGLIVWLI